MCDYKCWWLLWLQDRPLSVRFLSSLEMHTHTLCKEIDLDYLRAQNRMIFDHSIKAKPMAYPFVTLPPEEAEVVPENGEQES